MDFFKGLLGPSESPTQPSAAETIEKLLDRVQTSTLLDDRRDACRALKSLSRPYRVEVGAQGLDTLLTVLESDKQDNEIVSYVLDSLCSIISGPNEDPFESPAATEAETEDVGIQFTEIFAKKKENVALLLDLLSEADFKVRWPALKLLMGLLRHRLKEIQECVLSYPMGVSRLMDLLSDSREIIRNDAILVLVLLTRGNSNIQKIVAFENAFDKIFDILSAEGFTEGGVVVEDCLLVLQNLLKNNTSNQNFFKEGSFIQRLTPFLEFTVPEGSTDPHSSGWPAQKTSNLLFFLQVIRALVSPTNPAQVTSSAQKVLSSSGIVKKLVDLVMASGIPTELLTETICSVGEAVRGDHHNQEYLSKVDAPTTPPKPVLVVLMMSMVNEKQGFELRCAVLYAFQCFLFKNELGQAQVIETLLPNSPEIDPSSVTTGQLLCGGLFSTDSLTNWLVCIALSHVLVDNKIQKEQLLRVQLATDPSSQPVSLMTQVCSMLQQGVKFQKRVGLLIFLGTWLSHCPLAVSHFLNIPTNIPYLTSQVSIPEGDEYEIIVQGLCAFLLGLCITFNDDSTQSFTRDDLRQLITKRAGLETFLDKLSSVSKSSYYSLAAQRPQLKFRKAEDLVFDHEFCNLFKTLEHVVAGTVRPDVPSDESSLNADQNRLLTQYKEMIRQQDQELQMLRHQVHEYQQQLDQLRVENGSLASSVQQLKDQNALLRAQQNVVGVSNYASRSMSYAEEGFSPQLVDDLRRTNDQLQVQVHELTAEVNRLRLAPPPVQESFVSLTPSTHDQELVNLRAENDFFRQEVTRLSGQIHELSQQQHFQQQQQQFLPPHPPQLQSSTASSTTDSHSNELETLRKEQEDLLLLLTDQDTKLREYKEKLRQLGHSVEDDDTSNVGDSYDVNGV